MSPNQQRKWTSAKNAPVEILIERSGDKPLHEFPKRTPVTGLPNPSRFRALPAIDKL